MSQPNPDDQPITAGDVAGIDDSAVALMINIMQHSRQEADHITNGLVAGYQRDYYRTWAELRVVQRQVELLFVRGFMPTPDAILDAVYHPDPAAVAELVAQFERGQF